MNVPSHNFGNLLVGAIARHTVRVVNKEHTPFSFEFKLDQSSNNSESEPSALKILPQRGTVGPESSTEIELIFEPKTEKVFNFNVICDVKRKQDPVVLNVKGVGYKLHAQLTVEEFGMTREFMPGVRERIDFGELQVKETRSVKLRLKNKGPPPGSSLLPINFDFIVQVKSGRGPVVLGPTMGMFPPWVTINPVRATAVCYEEVEVHMAYTPADTDLTTKKKTAKDDCATAETAKDSRDNAGKTLYETVKNSVGCSQTADVEDVPMDALNFPLANVDVFAQTVITQHTDWQNAAQAAATAETKCTQGKQAKTEL